MEIDMPSPFLPLAKHSISKNDIQAVTQLLEESPSLNGKLIEEFENILATYCGAHYAVAFSSGTAAKMAAQFAAEMAPGDWVLTTPNSCIYSIGAAIQMGNRIYLVDIDLKTGNMDLNLLKSKLKLQSTRGRPFVMACHFAGNPLDMERVDRLICHPDAVVIEDASRSLGSSYSDGSRVGCCAYSQMTTFCFSSDKLINSGEGGLVTTNDPVLYQRLKLYRNKGILHNPENRTNEPWFHEYRAITGNFNFTDIQATLGLNQFLRIDELITKRRQLMQKYRDGLKGVKAINFLTEEKEASAAWQLCAVQIDFESLKTDRLAVMKALEIKGIDTDVHNSPLYEQPLVGPLLNWEEECPQNDLYYARALTLPLYHDLNFDDVNRICHELKSVLGISKHDSIN
jgi:dTDP-4-amino-4,6-dideoxygalactose transaminase